ncbi:non-oxidative hydroxyarylic acid decarboxylases subunit D [Vibrio ruber]|uniref:Phenolic acid decarboxylase subunit D n=1 Tax=Vibrio ruber (strain DSM 16370 / JCM 11486 / BCRC 17186 / CECT 7878 / LMG 23124 / VR1) TaxID=1123498 RepID=A0A1R4LFY7_VIBR1|nr:non-oxidative hydroxyarylic acid decarboxylases subunit D [Vibrio ruber]WNJ97936.1 non-oxidative hydroxyarylic acid decarboxylases subunit D [Vibrio ruber]SJN55353.1 Phenolic acid decarboxylase subunit D [Vibrio ruber DSM 16370]
MICPRCAHEEIALLAQSPVADVWTVHQCQRCLYTWRSTEPLRRTSREHFPDAFKMTPEEIDNAMQLPEIPPLLPVNQR